MYDCSQGLVITVLHPDFKRAANIDCLCTVQVAVRCHSDTKQIDVHACERSCQNAMPLQPKSIPCFCVTETAVQQHHVI